MGFFRKIGNAVLNFSIKRIVEFFKGKVDNTEFEKPLDLSLDTIAITADIFTDNDPNNKEQLKKYFKQNKEKYIDAGIGLIETPLRDDVEGTVYEEGFNLSLEFIRGLAGIYTDENPANAAQLEEFLQENKERYIKAASLLLTTHIVKIKNDFSRESAGDALNLIIKLIKEEDEQHIQVSGQE